MGWDVGKSLLNNPHIAVTSAAAQIPGPSFPLESQLRRHGSARERGTRRREQGHERNRGRSEKTTRQRSGARRKQPGEEVGEGEKEVGCGAEGGRARG